MKCSITRVLALAGFAIVLPLPFLSASTPAAAKDKYECFTDEGYGRRRPCSADYKTQNPNWRGSNECMTDEGYGRYRPCSANYKRKHAKN